MPFNLAAAKRAIFAECRGRGIDDDTRHAIIRDIGKVASGSAADLGAEAARRVLDHLRGKSAPVARRAAPNEWAWVNLAQQDKRPLLWKLRRLCIGAGIDPGKQVGYCEGVAAQMAGLKAAPGAAPIDKPLAMCSYDELWLLVAALAKHVRRHGQDPNAVGAG